MSSPYTDRFGYSLTAAQTLRRMQSPKSTGYYDAQGRWRKRTAKRVVPAKETPPRKESTT